MAELKKAFESKIKESSPELAAQLKVTLAQLGTCSPYKDFMLRLLASLDENHRFFKADFVMSHEIAAPKRSVTIREGFLSELPSLGVRNKGKRQVKRSRVANLLMNPVAVEKERIERLDKRIEALVRLKRESIGKITKLEQE